MNILTSKKNIFSDIATKQLLFLYTNKINNDEYDSLLLLELTNRYFKEDRSFNLYDLIKDDYKLFYFLVEVELTQETVCIPDEHIVSFLNRLLELVTMLKEKINNNHSKMDWSFEKLIGLEDLLNKFKTLKVRKPEFVRQINTLIEEINVVRNKLKEVLIIKNKETALEIINKDIALRELMVLKIPVSQLKQADWVKAIENINLYEKDVQIKLLKRTKSFNDLFVLRRHSEHVLGLILTNVDKLFFINGNDLSTKSFLSNIDILTLFNNALSKYKVLEEYISIRDCYTQILNLMENSKVRIDTIIYQKRILESKKHSSEIFSKSVLFHFKLFLLKTILLKLPKDHSDYSLFKKEYYELLFGKFHGLYKITKNNKDNSLYILITKKRKNIEWSFSLFFNKLIVNRSINNENLFVSSFPLLETMFINPKTSIQKEDFFITGEYFIIYNYLLLFFKNFYFTEKVLKILLPKDDFFVDRPHNNYYSLLKYRIFKNLFTEKEAFLFFKSINGCSFLRMDSHEEILFYLKESNLNIYDFSKKSDIKYFLSLRNIINTDYEILNTFLKKISPFYPNDYFIAINYFSVLKNSQSHTSHVFDYFFNKFN